MTPVRLVVVDDHMVFREGLRALLGRVDDIEIVGEAATTQEAIEVTEAARPDVVLMDLHLPGGAQHQRIARVDVAHQDGRRRDRGPRPRHVELPVHLEDARAVQLVPAYLVGSLIGKHKMVPHISPGKTWEGFAGAILFAAEKATWMAGEAIQCLGGNGYINDYPTGRLWRDAKLYEIGAGTSEIRRMLIGRELFSDSM